jgi:stearoyl-CoA desaturase (delta-9 desaturase)
MKTSHLNWVSATFLISYQLLLLITLPIYFYYASPSGALIGITIALFFMTGISITGGYHRLFAHRSYRTNSFVEGIVLFFASLALQGSALRWAYEHRLHHAHVDTDDDPYSINKGFWYAHFLWLVEKKGNRAIEKRLVSDLLKDKLVVFQHRYIKSCMLGSNIVVTFLIGWWLNDFIGAIVLSALLRIFALHHCTWFINSLAHTWGDKPFCQEQTAVNNCIIAFLTFGEGYHNYHHTFAQDYRNGIRWYHYDPTKWFIWTLNKIGMAYNLKRMDAYTIKKRLVLERKHLLLDKICELWYVKKDELEKQINELAERIMIKIAQANQLKEYYQKVCKECKEQEVIAQIQTELSLLKKSLKEDWRLWKNLSRHILRLEPIQI